ncbi:MAG: phenylalanine--tRNA ligase subunit alpha [Thermoplasmatota archaeon]
MDLSLAEKRLLAALPDEGNLAASDVPGFASATEALHAAGGLQRHGLVDLTESTTTTYALSEEGLAAQAEGLPERRAAQALAAAGGSLAMGDVAKAAGLAGPQQGIATGWLKRKGWADIQKGEAGASLVLKAGEPTTGDDEALLATLSAEPQAVPGDAPGLKQLLDRKGLLIAKEQVTRALALTDAGGATRADLDLNALDGAAEVNQVTPDLIARWADMTDDEKAKLHLRAFDFDVPVAARDPGKTHPLTQLMTGIRQVFWNLGFQEIAGDYVESAFWNMDALFIPQDHPARDMQDTFYLEHPATAPVTDDDLARGAAIHKDGGGTGSTGWGGAFSEEVSRSALLRTHTTNTTVRFLADNPTGAHKVFGLGKVFRKETMDATHLPEFYQIEGIVTEPGASFDMLVGLCRTFFTRMGFPEVRFRPAYFPYTEPSMEIDVMYNGKWMELGGCGVFRPEVTQPLGVEHPVLAWGFGLERLAMMKLGLKDIRQLYVSDVQWLKETALQE